MNTFEFAVGRIRCIAIWDGDHQYRAEDYVVDVAPDQVAEALTRHGHEPNAIPSPYSGLLVESDDRLILIDTGAGDLTPNVGRLRANLRRAGRQPDDIDTVVITHAHPDHIGGNTYGDGQAVFARARYVLWRSEWEWWTNEANLARLAPVFGEWVRRHLLPLRERVELLDREVALAPGVNVLAAPGHTEGHAAVALESDGQQLFYVSDAALHPIHLEHPEWHPVWDQDCERASASKRRLFDEAARQQALILAFHFPPFPSLGLVERHGHGWHWLPVDANTSA